MSQRAQTKPSIILLTIGMAIILAAGLFLAVSAIQNRPDQPEGVEIVNVAGQDVTLRRDPQLLVRLAPLPVEPAQPEVEPPPEAAVSEEPAAETQPPPEDTPVPETSGGQPDPTPVPPTAVGSVIFIDYVVQPNDTLYSIAQRLDTSIVLMARYNISAASLVAGQTIRLPVGNPAYCPGRQPYAVGEGDTAFNLGRRFNTTAAELQAINGLDANYTIRVGEIICIP